MFNVNRHILVLFDNVLVFKSRVPNEQENRKPDNVRCLLKLFSLPDCSFCYLAFFDVLKISSFFQKDQTVFEHLFVFSFSVRQKEKCLWSVRLQLASRPVQQNDLDLGFPGVVLHLWILYHARLLSPFCSMNFSHKLTRQTELYMKLVARQRMTIIWITTLFRRHFL